MTLRIDFFALVPRAEYLVEVRARLAASWLAAHGAESESAFG